MAKSPWCRCGWVDASHGASALAAFAGLRLAEVCGLRVADVDIMRGIVKPAVQYPADTLKTEASRTPVPIPRDLAMLLSGHVSAYPSVWLLSDDFGRQLAPGAL